VGDVVAENVINWTVWLFFEDGDSARVADPSDGDDTNDYDDLVSGERRWQPCGTRGPTGTSVVAADTELRSGATHRGTWPTRRNR
jgi:hypothetical protein